MSGADLIYEDLARERAFRAPPFVPIPAGSGAVPSLPAPGPAAPPELAHEWPAGACGNCGNDARDTTLCDGCKFEVCRACGFPCACGDEPVFDTWPHPADQAADAALEHIRATFDLLRRMYL